MPATGMQRAAGRAAVELSLRGGATRLDRLHQSGSAKAILPRVHGPEPEVVFLNTAGGLTGGDAMSFALTLGEGARATATTQTAERAYDAAGGTARVDVRMRIGRGGRVDWLPQETILFDRAGLRRRTEIALEGDAECLTVEALMLGRAAMGETVRRLVLDDRRSILRDRRPVMIEPLRLDEMVLGGRDPALLRGALAVATLAFVARGSEDAVATVRELLDAPEVEAAASGWDGRLVLRAFAPDAFPLRRLLSRVLIHLRGGPLPRVWQS